MKTALHSGDLGDIVYSLASFLRVPGPKKMHLCTRPWTKELTKTRYETIAPLLESQGVIASPHEPTEPVDYDYSTFRSAGIPWAKNLVKIQADYVKIPIPDYEPWLKAEPHPASRDRIIVHRSPRYHNGWFPWRLLFEKFGPKLLAVGLPNEHEELERTVGGKIDFYPTKSYDELAQLIAGSLHFVGNQSSPLSIAIGLGHPTTQEVCQRVPDCLFPSNKNLQHSITGELTILGEILQESKKIQLPITETPAGGWVAHWDGKTYNNKISYRALQRQLIQNNCPQQLTDELIQTGTIQNIVKHFPSALPKKDATIKILLQHQQ